MALARWIAALAMAILSGFALHAHAEPVQGEIFAALEGKWQAEGEAFGAPARTEMQWSPALDGRFQRIDYRIVMQRGESEQSFVGIGHYRMVAPDHADGYWVDNSGDMHPLSATLTATGIETIWGIAGGKQGRTRYALREDGRVEITDWLLTDAGWKEFNHSIVSRIAE
ncbi:MAG: hypothetical protein R3E02_13710 [Blastomonas sp.]